MSYANIVFPRFDFVLLQIILQEAEIMNQGKTVNVVNDKGITTSRKNESGFMCQ